ncbi:MAG: uncharacterized protein KVP18_002426 [Porospora cf. gigantea A]|uniref:uncharacterized protein n=2 Tax=Porospora cf. gigantea A TaxID=2853593 RepID=UPI00355A27B4|nr:MAG: hypothetical protein KVP18_002426 [Porospora cf. gigantea A]
MLAPLDERKSKEHFLAMPPYRSRSQKFTVSGQAKIRGDATLVQADVRVTEEANVKNFSISKEVRARLRARGIEALFPIQCACFNDVFEGKDVVGRARTGTGKTLAFTLPTLERLSNEGSWETKRGRTPKMMVLLPTRELAIQVAQEIDLLAGEFTVDPLKDVRSDKEKKKFGDTFPTRLTTMCLYGGAPIGPMIQSLRQGVDVAVGCPGRINDLIERQQLLLEGIDVLVLDEADRMLEMGFKEEVDAILEKVKAARKSQAKTSRIQYLLFSATLPDWIWSICDQYMHKHKTFDVVGSETNTTNTNIRHLAMEVGYHERKNIISDVVKMYAGLRGKVIIFCETKRTCNEVALETPISNICMPLHGDIEQKTRESTLNAFKKGGFRVLVATDVAARGLHVDNVDLVLHFSMPGNGDQFVHRSGRTARAGRSGTNMVLFKRQERPEIAALESAIGISFEKVLIPSVPEILKGASHAIVKGFVLEGEDPNEDRDSLVDLMRENAKALIEDCEDAETAVSRCLLELAGYDQAESLKVRSPLTGAENVKVYQASVDGDMELRSLFYPVRLINSQLESLGVNLVLDDHLGQIRFLKGKSGIVFELRQEAQELFDANLSKLSTRQVKLSHVAELPQLEEAQSAPYESRGGGFRGRDSRGGRGGPRYGGRGGSDRVGRGGYKREFNGDGPTSMKRVRTA